MAEDEGNKKSDLERKKIAEAIQTVLEEQQRTKEEINSLDDEGLRIRRELLAANMENNLVEGEMLIRMGQVAQAAEAYTRAQKEHKTLLEMKAAAIHTGGELDAKIAKARSESNEKELSDLLEQKDAIIERRDALEQEIKSYQDRLDLLEQATEKHRGMTKAGKDASKSSEKYFQGIATGIFQMSQAQDTMMGGLLANIQKAKGKGGFEGIAEGFGKVFNITNLAASATQLVIDSFLTMALSLDKATASFAAATGTGRQYMQSIENVRKTNAHLGVSMENTTQAFEGLLTEMIGFTSLSTETKESLAGQAAQLDRLGIKTEQAADLMNTFSKIMGASAKESLNLTKDLALMGTSIGISSKRMIKDFQQAGKILSVYGKRSVGVFTNMAAAAKAAGVEMNTLLGVVGQFDTFEDAADSAAKLNAILGSNISATQMNRMTEDERIETIIRQIQVSGQSFAQMDKFKQMAIANAVGITDMAEANKLFGMSMSQYRNYTDEMKNAKTAQEELDKATKATQTIQEQFVNLMAEFAPQITSMLDSFKSGMETLSGILSKVNRGLEHMGMSLGGVVFILGTLILTGKILGPVWKLGAWALGLYTKMSASSAAASQADAAAKIEQSVAGETQNATQTKLNTTSKAGIGTMLAMGAAILMIGGGIFIAAMGMAEFVKAFGGLTGEQLLAASFGLVMFGLGMIKLMSIMLAFVAGPQLAASAAAVALLLGVGKAAVLVGVGVGIAAFGMSKLVESIGSLGENGLSAAAAFAAISASMLVMSVGAAILAVSLLVMIPALIGVGVTSIIAAVGIGILGIGMAIAGGGALIFGLGLDMVASALLKITSGGSEAAMTMGAVGLGLLGMAAGLAAMFIFISNPLGWLVIGAAMRAMSKGISAFTSGLAEMDGEKLRDLQSISEQFSNLAGLSMDATIIGTVTSEIENFQDTLDTTLMAQVASLGVFSDIRSINSTKAETQIQNQIKMPEYLTLNAEHTIHTNIGDKPFNKAVRNSVNKIPWGSFDEGPKNIVAAGN